MIFRSSPFSRVTIVGVGLMGGSLGMAIKKKKLAKEVVGLSHRQSSLVEAIKLKAIDSGYTDIKRAIKNADLVILAAPVDSIIKLFKMINPHLKRGAVVTDLGSVKVEIQEAAEKDLSNPTFFLGSHPLTGSDKKEISNALPELYDKATCIITPVKSTNASAIKKLKAFWSQLDMKVESMGAEEHDQILSYTSHLPHVISYGFMETVPDKFIEYGSGSFNDLTRIASSSPKLWKDICFTNSKNIIKSLDEFVGRLSELRDAIVKEDEKILMKHFNNSKEKKDSTQKK